jgi:hypothetical protein
MKGCLFFHAYASFEEQPGNVANVLFNQKGENPYEV